METANLHHGTATGELGTDLCKRPRRWLEQGALAMAQAVSDDWHEWTRRG